MISVIVCVRNGATTLRQQLDALAAQQDAPPFEVVIVDNGSTDATADVARAWMADGIGSAIRAHLVDASERAGIGFARNVGAASSSGDVLAYCDADDAVGPHWVRGAAAVDDDGPRVATGPIFELRADGTRGDILMNGIDGTRLDAGAVRSCPFFRGCNFALTRAAFEQVGGFDAGLPAYGSDDSEIGIRIARAGIEIGLIPDMAVSYRLSSGWRQRLRRRYRAGIGQAVQWYRHPDFYRRPPAPLTLAAIAPIAAVRTLVRTRGRIPTRLLRAAEEGVYTIGALAGTRGIRARRWGSAELYDPERDRRGPSPAAPPPPHLALITPVRHPLNSSDYAAVERALRQSVTSWLRQTDPKVVVIVVASRRPDLPDDPRIHVVTVDFPPPSPERTARTGDEAVLRDKGSKNAIGLGVAQGLDARHVMFADADDFVSRRLAAYAHAHPAHPGWTVTDGWRVNLRRRTVRPHRGDFHLQCGTSHIVRTDLLPVTDLGPDASQDQLYGAYGDRLERWLGSHMHLHDDLPLTPLPFAGALYQVGTTNSQSGNALGGQGRPISRRISEEFGVPATSPTPAGLARALLPSWRAVRERARRMRRAVLSRMGRAGSTG